MFVFALVPTFPRTSSRAPDPKMAPSAIIRPGRSSIVRRYLEGEPGSWRKNATEDAFILESWGQGFIVGALLIMALITISNMKKGIVLHKLIFIEVRGELKKNVCSYNMLMSPISSFSPFRMARSAS